MGKEKGGMKRGMRKGKKNGRRRAMVEGIEKREGEEEGEEGRRRVKEDQPCRVSRFFQFFLHKAGFAGLSKQLKLDMLEYFILFFPLQRSYVMITNTNFRIPLSWQPDV